MKQQLLQAELDDLKEFIENAKTLEEVKDFLDCIDHTQYALYDKFMDITKLNPEGFTCDLEGNKIKDGFAVGTAETDNCTGRLGLMKVLRDSYKRFLQVGGWLDKSNNVFYYNSVRVYDNIRQAMDFAIANNQKVIYDLHNKKEIKL